MRGSWRLNKDCNILTSPALLDIAGCRSRSPGLLNRRPGGPLRWVLTFSNTSCHKRVWSPNWLVSKLDSKLTDFLSSPSYIIVQSPTQYLEWHVWSSSSGNNCHAVYSSCSSGASVYDCTAGFYLVPYCQPSTPTPKEYELPPSLEWHIWPGRRSIYNTWNHFLWESFVLFSNKYKYFAKTYIVSSIPMKFK